MPHAASTCSYHRQGCDPAPTNAYLIALKAPHIWAVFQLCEWVAAKNPRSNGCLKYYDNIARPIGNAMPNHTENHVNRLILRRQKMPMLNPIFSVGTLKTD